jgi:serine/threonine-protein kinase
VETARLLAGRYRLIERLGAGGMSVVWRGFDEVLTREVAVKLLAAEHASDDASRCRLRTEAQAAACLTHPHVTNVYDYGDDAGTSYVVMELIDGTSMSARLARGLLPWRTAVRICAEVAAGLAAAHARGLVHRDVKPGNVMLTRTGVKVVDFGIAAVAGERADSSEDGILLGTPAYLAPERLLGGPVQPATDVYALGVMLYRALSGSLPWQADTPTEIISAHCRAEPDPLPPLPEVPDVVIDSCMRCLAKVPGDRPTSVEVARTLAGAIGIEVPLPEPGRRVPPLAALSSTIELPTEAIAAAHPGKLFQRLAVAAAGVAAIVALGGFWAERGAPVADHATVRGQQISEQIGIAPGVQVVNGQTHQVQADSGGGSGRGPGHGPRDGDGDESGNHGEHGKKGGK